jgi:hypothetical protein
MVQPRETRTSRQGDDRCRRRLAVAIYMGVTVAINLPASFVAALGG